MEFYLRSSISGDGDYEDRDDTIKVFVDDYPVKEMTVLQACELAGTGSTQNGEEEGDCEMDILPDGTKQWIPTGNPE
nr:NADH dehydrogenase [ubiquinone] iron-sulfur protein 1, mitochondrial-like [Ipomoea batatas]